VLAFLLVYLLPSTIYILIRIGIAGVLLHPESSVAEKVYKDLVGPFLKEY
jgi:hypothetical protein